MKLYSALFFSLLLPLFAQGESSVAFTCPQLEGVWLCSGTTNDPFWSQTKIDIAQSTNAKGYTVYSMLKGSLVITEYQTVGTMTPGALSGLSFFCARETAHFSGTLAKWTDPESISTDLLVDPAKRPNASTVLWADYQWQVQRSSPTELTIQGLAVSRGSHPALKPMVETKIEHRCKLQ